MVKIKRLISWPTCEVDRLTHTKAKELPRVLMAYSKAQHHLGKNSSVPPCFTWRFWKVMGRNSTAPVLPPYASLRHVHVVVRARPRLPPFLIYANLHLEISGTMYAKLLVCKKLGRVDWTSTVRKMPRKKRRLRLKVRVHTLASRQLHQMKEKKITSQLNRQISWLTCEVDRLKLKKIPTLKQKNLALRLERTLGYKTLPELEDILMAKKAQLKSEVLRRRHRPTPTVPSKLFNRG